MSNLTQGNRVFHPNQKSWGLGKVLNVTHDSIDIFFVGTGTKRLAKSFVQLEVAEGAEAKHRLLDNLIDPAQISNADYVTSAKAIERFLAIYPEGFTAASFLKEERDANLRAHQFCVQLLGETEMTELIDGQRYQDICDRARHVESVANVLTKSEKTALNKTLDEPINQKIFALSLFALLYGTESEEERFKAFARSLALLEINRWPYATLFSFIRYPLEKVFIKPTVIQNVAKALHWRINYKSEPNWLTYSAIVRFYQHLNMSLVEEGLVPRDMIDVQAFICLVGRK